MSGGAICSRQAALFVDFKAKVFRYIDRVAFWKLAHWLARKYRTGIASLV